MPWSYWHGKPLAPEEYLAAPMINDPICRFDCDIPVDGDPPAEGNPPGAARRERAARMVARWRRESGLLDDRLFAERLGQDGLTPDRLVRIPLSRAREARGLSARPKPLPLSISA